jgi:hypothetical protein
MCTKKRLMVSSAVFSFSLLAAGTAVAQDAARAEGDEAARVRQQDGERHQYQHRHGAQAEGGAGDPAGDAQELRQRTRSGVQARQRGFVDRDGDGVCDRFQAKETARKRLHKGKANRNRHGNGSMRGFGRGNGSANAGSGR